MTDTLPPDSQQRLRHFRRQLQERVDSFERGEAIELEGEEELAAFFDEIEAEVHAEIATGKNKVSPQDPAS